MTNNQERLKAMLEKLDFLTRAQAKFEEEFDELREGIKELQNEENSAIRNTQLKTETPVIEKSIQDIPLEKVAPVVEKVEQPKPIVPEVKMPKEKSDIEKFIGENLINKIGIGILIIGVAIGAKYSIEHNLISPLTRIILGYLSGLGLMAFGMKLKKNYESFSAVLVSGAMAIMYFITFAAYSFYDLFPQTFAFALMLIFTVFTVFAAIKYNRQIIAHIGLVGAYAVPFLLSDGSGKIAILFTYMAILNAGILAIAFKKYWKPLFYVSFALTWLIVLGWYAADYSNMKHFALGITFATLFFILFYITLLAYKLRQKEQFNASDIILQTSNAFLFYGIGYLMLDGNDTGRQLLGLFTLANAVIHFAVSLIIFKKNLSDKKLLYLSIGLVLIFITITVPVQLDGNWVTLLWIAEACVLFWIGRTKQIKIYELISYALVILSVFSVMQDWGMAYNQYYGENIENMLVPIFNINFLTSMFVLGGLGFIYWLSESSKYAKLISEGLASKVKIGLPILLVFIAYFAFHLEISNYWNQEYEVSRLVQSQNGEDYYEFFGNIKYHRYETIWLVNYSLIFVSLLSLLNLKWFKNNILAYANLLFSALAILVFLTTGLLAISELRDYYLNPHVYELESINNYDIIIRYVSILFVAFTLFLSYRVVCSNFIKTKLRLGFDLLFFISFLWVLSSELIHWMDMIDASESYKLGLSILWGVFSLGVIIYGIYKKKIYLRLGALVLFGITLLKLFFYDISHLNTISKTIVFVSLGVLLLVISFLYNKYKNIISDESKD